MSESTNYEYAIVYRLFPDDIHRGPFNKTEAERWVQEWLDDGGHPEAFTIVRRLVGSWDPVPDEEETVVSANTARAVFDMPEVQYDSGSLLGALTPKPWRVEYVSIRAGFDSPGEQALAEMLERGWEPFAVTVQETSHVTYTYHLRKQS